MKKVLLSIVAVVVIVTSCNEDLLNTKNPNQYTDGSFYTSLAQVGTSTNAIYALLQGNRLVGREYFFLHDLRSDEMKAGGGQLEVPRAQLLLGTHSYTNAVMSDVYRGLVQIVHRANVVIAKGGELAVAAGDQAQLDRYIAEAKFLRGFAYFQLGALWGGVPISETYATSFGDAKPRATQDAVLDFALADATAASLVLPWPSGYAAADRGRATKGAALLLAAKINLHKGLYTPAKTALESIRNSGEYSLVGNYYDNFMEETEYNSESIFEVGFLSDGYGWNAAGDGATNDSWVRGQEYGPHGWCNLVPSDKLIADFEDGDPRLNDSFWFPGDSYANGTLIQGEPNGPATTVFEGNDVKIRWKKYTLDYKLNPGGFNVNFGINYRLWRYADVLLLLAECENEVGTIPNAIARLNEVRGRASVSMPDYGTATMDAAGYPVTTKAEVFNAVQHERFIELCGEEVRNLDILRWRKNGKLTSEPISYFQANKYELLPIPQGEFNTNPALSYPEDQNPGYIDE